jgi:hypothetical protein
MARYIRQKEVYRPVGLAQHVISITRDEVRRAQLTQERDPTQPSGLRKQGGLYGGGSLKVTLQLLVDLSELLMKGLTFLLQSLAPDCVGPERPECGSHGPDLVSPFVLRQRNTEVPGRKSQHSVTQTVQRSDDPVQHSPSAYCDGSKADRENQAPNDCSTSRLLPLFLKLSSRVREEKLLQISPYPRDLPGARKYDIGAGPYRLSGRCDDLGLGQRQQFPLLGAVAFSICYLKGGQLQPDGPTVDAGLALKKLEGQLSPVGVAADLVPGSVSGHG